MSFRGIFPGRGTTRFSRISSTFCWSATWLPWAAGLGVAAHLAGDAVTVQGLPGRGGQRVGPRLFRTGGPGEAVVCIILAAVIAAYPYRGVLAAYLQGVIT